MMPLLLTKSKNPRTMILSGKEKVSGWLHGPDGLLAIITVWLRQHEDGVYRFVTLKPER
jgi:hypothetical protein